MTYLKSNITVESLEFRIVLSPKHSERINDVFPNGLDDAEKFFIQYENYLPESVRMATSFESNQIYYISLTADYEYVTDSYKDINTIFTDLEDHINNFLAEEQYYEGDE